MPLNELGIKLAPRPSRFDCTAEAAADALKR
jgi:hypothetical protein